ncbi:MAG: serine/threonine protein phosphatase, partial [Deltaproteobacteria bacterium]|nr:serine/threonine protein phosphatase [Deltaproteobacteria bacterium]
MESSSMFSSDPEVAKRQMLTVVFLLTAFGHADGKFDMAEKRFVQEMIAVLVEKRMLEAVSNPLARHATTDRVIAQFQRVAARIDREIVALLSESVAEGESQEQFILAKITLRCYELLRPLDEDARGVLFDIVDDFILADGVTHPAEEKLRDDLKRLLAEPMEITEFEVVEDESAENVQLLEEQSLVPPADDHPFFARLEQAYPRDRQGFVSLAKEDVGLVRKVRSTLDQQREAGAGLLTGARSFAEFAGQTPFLDGHVYVVPPDPNTEYELIVLGDLHGCYSCLKAALLQTDFLAKVQAHADDPTGTPDTRLVLLGDYIDRGRFSYDGILRAVMQLYVTVPNAVYMLRGNHEYYVELEGR